MEITLQASMNLSLHRDVKIQSVNDVYVAINNFGTEAGFSVETHNSSHGAIEYAMDEHFYFLIIDDDGRQFETAADFIRYKYIKGEFKGKSTNITLCFDTTVDAFRDIDIDCVDDIYNAVDAFQDDIGIREIRQERHGSTEYQTGDLIDGVIIVDSDLNYFNHPDDFVAYAHDK